MILELIALTALLADEPAKPVPLEPEKDETIEKYRSPFDVLNERMIGSASRATRFDWRNHTLSFGVIGGDLVELNNFQSERIGGFVRTSTAGLMLELDVVGVLTQGTNSTALLALTPYRQSGRPEHVEIDLNVGLPLLEGISTPRWGWVPTMEMVVFLTVDFRYRIYKDGVAKLNAGDSLLALFSPRMWDIEQQNLEPHRLPGMTIDRSKYDLLAGLTFEFQTQSGIFFAPRFMICPPILNGFTGSAMNWWWDFGASLGWGF